MITNTGKKIITKYLIGQVPSYASYIALGCGAKPVKDISLLGDYSAKTSLDFEMIRVPVTSRGLIVENGVEKIVLTAQLPAEERYEISEIGLYPAASNPLASGFDSRILYSFNSNESWIMSLSADPTNTAIPSITGQIDFLTSDIIFQSTASNTTLSSQERSERLERPRFLDNSIFIRGDSCKIYVIDYTLPEPEKNHIYTTVSNLNLSKNSIDDQIKIAYSVISSDPANVSENPANVNIILEFASNHSDDLSAETYARVGINNYEIDTTNRYFVSTIKLSDFTYYPSFSWDAIKYVKIYASAEVLNLAGTDTIPSSDYYICIDAIKLENVASLNSVYGLTGYSVVVNSISDTNNNTYPSTISKELNTSNYIEFRFVADVTP